MRTQVSVTTDASSIGFHVLLLMRVSHTHDVRKFHKSLVMHDLDEKCIKKIVFLTITYSKSPSRADSKYVKHSYIRAKLFFAKIMTGRG